MAELKSPLKPIKKKSLYLKISDSIYSYIQMNRLQPGDKLPSEREMSALLETSRNSVREALRILEDRGLIYVKTGSGVFIKSPYGDTSTLSFRLNNCTMDEIHELQSCLDHQAVGNAMKRATAEEKKEMVSIADEMVKLADENIYSHILDHSFHSKLYQSGRNNAVYQLIIKIREDRFVIQEDSEIDNDMIWLTTIPNHLDLAEAIMAQDIEKAIAAIDTINEHGFQIHNSRIKNKQN